MDWDARVARKNWTSVFLRVNNRKSRFTYGDLVNANYPMVEVTNHTRWRELHDLCKSQFIDEKGRRTYVWFGHRFFFLTDNDAHLFRGLQYLL
jgi:hypothetical protein